MADADLYVWGAYVMGATLVVTEVGLLVLRDTAIRRFLGWRRGYQPPAIASGESTEPSDGARGT